MDGLRLKIACLLSQWNQWLDVVLFLSYLASSRVGLSGCILSLGFVR